MATTTSMDGSGVAVAHNGDAIAPHEVLRLDRGAEELIMSLAHAEYLLQLGAKRNLLGNEGYCEYLSNGEYDCVSV